MALWDRPFVRFGRTISVEFESAFSTGGPLRWMVERANGDNPMLDLHFRSEADHSGASLYAGLIPALQIAEVRGHYWLHTYDTDPTVARIDLGWSETRRIGPLAVAARPLEEHLDRILAPGASTARFTDDDGLAQSVISRAVSDQFGCFQRKAVPAFETVDAREAIVAQIVDQMTAALADRADRPRWWNDVRDRSQILRPVLDADLMAVDPEGRLLVVEVESAHDLEGIAWAPGKARLHAELFAFALDRDPAARDELTSMIEQRRRLGLPAPPWPLADQQTLRVVPVVAIGPGPQSRMALERLESIHQALERHPPGSTRIDPLEVWHHDEAGQRVARWRPGLDEMALDETGSVSDSDAAE